MKTRFVAGLFPICVSLAVSGCAGLRSGTPAHGRAVFSSLQQAVAAAGKKAEPSLALVKVEKSVAAPVSPMAAAMGAASSGSSASCGVLLTTNGYLLASVSIKPEDDVRLTVLVGDNEYTARLVKSDDTLGMAILKIVSDDVFVPLDLNRGADLALGEWAVILRPTDEDNDYRKISALAVCQGEKAGRYRAFLLDAPSLQSGAPVFNIEGEMIGLVNRGSVLSFNDLRDDLKFFIAESTGSAASDEESKKKGWFGAMLQPINKDYAKLKGLSPSSLHVIHAVKDGPAEKAGVRVGDLIVGLNGKPLALTGNRAFDYFMKSLHPRVGEKFSVTVLRNGERVELAGTVTKSPEPATLRAEDIGVTVSSISDQEVFMHNLQVQKGVLVTEVTRGSPAANSGSLGQSLIITRDVIVELDGRPTPTVDAFSKIVESLRKERKQVVLVKYYRGRLTGYAGLNLSLGQKQSGEKQ